MTALINRTHRNHRQTHRNHWRRAFTLTELQVVIALIAVVNALLLPGVTRSIFFARANNVEYVGHDACHYINAIYRLRGRFPDDLEELRDFLIFNNELSEGDWVAYGDGDMLIEHGRVRMQFAQEESEIALHLEFLRAIDNDADDFISQVMDRPRPGPLLILSTVEPQPRDLNQYARIWVYFDVTQCGEGAEVERFVAFESAAAPTPVDPIDTAALQSVAIMLQSDTNSRERAREIPTILRDPAAVEFVHAVFDRNFDGAITLGEFSQKSRQLAESPPDDDSALGQQVTKQFFRVVVNELSLTAADDESDAIIFSIDDAHGDPTELFSYQNLCDHTSLYVVDRQAEDKLCRRLRLAEFLEEKDLLRSRDNVLTAQQRLLHRLSGDSLLPEAADELDILTEVRKGFGR